MTDPTPPTNETTEADDAHVRPDPGPTREALREALSGSGVGSDTRAGSLQGGAATGSDDDPDQRAVDRVMRDQGGAAAGTPRPRDAMPAVVNTGPGPGESDGNTATPRDTDADAATG